MSPAPGDLRAVQIYEVVRTAHLERAAAMPERPVILYRRRRYDFDQDAARRVVAERRGVIGAVAFALRHDVDVIEVNEPLAADSPVRAVAFVAAARLRAFARRRRRPSVVAYAIENLEPQVLLQNLPFKARWRYRLGHLATPLLWRALDRIAYGTAGARDVYERAFRTSRHRPESIMIEALPAPAAIEAAPRGPIIVFLGDLSDRKGLPDLLAAWPAVRRNVPDARLVIVGRGAQADSALTLSADDDRVETVIDPPRTEIFERLGTAKVLVLPSRRRPLWREQVGLPIVEGLASGCLVVTTAETGIADWLGGHGHWVVPEGALSERLAPAVVEALRSGRGPADVWADLPGMDGRREAQEWLYENGPLTTP